MNIQRDLDDHRKMLKQIEQDFFRVLGVCQYLEQVLKEEEENKPK